MIKTYVIDELKRTITPAEAEKYPSVVIGDDSINGIEFEFPNTFEHFDLFNGVKHIIYVKPNNEKKIKLLTETSEETGRYLWRFDDGINHGDPGMISFALMIDMTDDEGTILKTWMSLPASFDAVKSLGDERRDDADEEEAYSERLAAAETSIANLRTLVSNLSSGTPTAADSPDGLIDHGKLYVATFTDEHYTRGNWYYWNGEDWADGGQYGGLPSGAIQTDAIADGAVTEAKLASGVKSLINDRAYHMTVTGDETAYSLSSGTYSGATAAITAGKPTYLHYGLTDYHLVRTREDDLTFSRFDGVFFDSFVLSASAITRVTVDVASSTEVSTALANALTNWKLIYDRSDRGQDVFEYAKARVDELKQHYVDPLREEIQAAYVVRNVDTDVTYTSLKETIDGALSLSHAYVEARLKEYKAFTIKIVDTLPVAGESMTFYLVPNKAGNGYDKYWWITTGTTSKWDVFGSATTLVVDVLPAAGDPDTDYILKTSAGCLYYKYFDSDWHMVGGSLAEILKTLPETGDAYTDYYVANAAGTYVHYRWIGGKWEIIGSDSYTKGEVDTLISNATAEVTAIGGRVASAETNINSLSRTVDKVVQDLANLDTEGYTYDARLSTEGDNRVFTLYETQDGVETVKSQFTLPAGGGGGSSTVTNLVVDKITASPLVLTPTDKAIIEIDYSSTDEDGELVDGSYIWRLGSTTIASGTLTQGRNSFDLTEYCSVGTQKLMLTVTDEGGSVAVKSWTVQIVDVRLESAFSDRYTNPVGKSVNFTYTPYGAVAKTVHFKLDGVELPEVTTSASGTLQSYALDPQTHGAHLLECWITATVSNTAVETEHIFRDIIWYDETSSVPVIGCAYRYDHYGEVAARQYDTTRIAYTVYDPKTSTPEVTLSVDGEEVSSLKLTEALNTWAYKSEDVAVHVLTITCGAASVEIRVNVGELGYDVSPVTANLEFDFNPTGRSNSSANRLWEDAEHPDVKMTVSENFDWQNGGYKLDGDGNQYFCIKAGSRAYISYNLFGTDPKQAGEEFKVIFKTANVRDNTTSFLTCLPDDAVPVGLDMKAHAAYIKTSTSELYVPYSEEDVIELEYNVNPLDLEDASATSYIMSYEDGVGARPLIYDSSHRLHQYSPVPITIGSDDCDVWIYRMMAYSSALADTDVLKNFIADARDSETMIARYERNQIYDENAALTPDSVAAACPDLRVIMIDCPRFTTDKKDYVKNTTVRCICKGGDPVYDNWTWYNGYVVGQGTTSNEYGFAGRNLDIIFGFDGKTQRTSKIPLDETYISELVLGDGTRYSDGTGKVRLTPTSVPNDWFNIKVNIASSENANNALLQKRYNDFLPYRTPGQKRDSRIKNSMEFQNCVVFIREYDSDLSTHKEFSDTAWHFYAIGNIGDSKKTDSTRVNDPTDLKEFVVEVSDNTLPNAWFQTGVYKDSYGTITYDPEKGVEMVYPITKAQWASDRNLKRQSLYEAWDDSFEFRYDMGTKDGETISDEEIDAQQELSKQVWRDMYEWVVTATDEKFVSEFGNWFIRESPLYWYLFTERYTMIDNRAKNSFWHFGKAYITAAEAAELGDDAQYYTIDDAAAAINGGYRFDLWDYDNDTAIGINNSGELTMTYGKEDTDYKVDGDASSGFIFNAAQSVFWRRIRALMGSELQAMYLDRESAGCWSAEGLIAEFDAWQEEFPEELWRLDIERKYLRTYRAGTVRFFNEMANGRKRYQRRQFERDQEAYIGTKYVGTAVKSDQIMFRCNTPSGVVVSPDYTLRLVPYSDMYLTVLYGNSPAPVQVRAKAGVEYTLTTPLTEMDDTAILIYCASRIQAVNDLSACYIHDNDFSKASKLKTLIIGNTTEGYSNSFLTTLNMGQNTLLETLDIRNCPNLTGSVNLSACENLVNLYAEGTALTSVLFAANGKIIHVHLPATINSLTFRSIKHLTDLVATYGNLEAFVCEYSDIDALGIIQAAVDTLQICRVLDIDWTLADTTLLNKILGMSSSLLTGKIYVSGQIRNRELTSYAAAWPDLVVTYDPAKLVTQYEVKFVNTDGSVLYTEYIDRGSAPVDPVEAGYIETPTRAADEQYSYSYTGWDDAESPVLTERTITAQYEATIRTYTVNWWARQGVLLASKTVNYAEEAVFDGETPVNTEEEATYVYNLFAGWDKSTGCVKEDLDVYAVWERASLPAVGTELSTMSRAEIFAVCRADRAATYWEDKDAFELTLGHDFAFTNIQSRELIKNRYFNGTSDYVDTGIKLFDPDAGSFTLAIDFEFCDDNVAGATLVAAFEESGNEGFRLRYSSNPYIQWGDKEARVGAEDDRGMVVLRHRKGSNILSVYTYSLTEKTLDAERTDYALTRTRETSFDGILTFGAVRFAGDGGHDYFGRGWIHWCKIWHEDLGDDVAKKLAAWPHETVRAEFTGANRYRLAGTSSQRAAASFLLEDALAVGRRFNATNTNVGGWDGSELRTVLNTRVLEAFGTGWRSMLQKVKTMASAGNKSTEILTSEDYIFLPAERELGGEKTTPYINEGEQISFYTTGASRFKFRGILRKTDAQIITNTSDPTETGYTVTDGDIWINTSKNSNAFVYLSKETAAKHTSTGARKLSHSDNIDAADGGIWVQASWYWERSAGTSNASNFRSVSTGGGFGANGAAYVYALVPGFNF